MAKKTISDRNRLFLSFRDGFMNCSHIMVESFLKSWYFLENNIIFLRGWKYKMEVSPVQE